MRAMLSSRGTWKVMQTRLADEIGEIFISNFSRDPTKCRVEESHRARTTFKSIESVLETGDSGKTCKRLRRNASTV